ncbi:MAG: zinc ribbon domain-containing protein [Tissierellia bacterium]|nr:zinc ribbon domain-containing protein [Tissierellia bacterium]
MNCVKCNAPIPEGSSYCTQCGSYAPASSTSQQQWSSTTSGANQGGYNPQGGNPSAQYQNQNYGGGYPQAQPQYQPKSGELGKVMSYGDCMLFYLILAIPIVGFVMMIIWAINGKDNPSRMNLCRASLTYMAISVVLALVMGGALISIVEKLAR